jgi:hypothetical protein
LPGEAPELSSRIDRVALLSVCWGPCFASVSPRFSPPPRPRPLSLVTLTGLVVVRSIEVGDGKGGFNAALLTQYNPQLGLGATLDTGESIFINNATPYDIKVAR